jgi:hypothetical protein
MVLQPGQMLSRYRLVEKLGQAGQKLAARFE